MKYYALRIVALGVISAAILEPVHADIQEHGGPDTGTADLFHFAARKIHPKKTQKVPVINHQKFHSPKKYQANQVQESQYKPQKQINHENRQVHQHPTEKLTQYKTDRPNRIQKFETGFQPQNIKAPIINAPKQQHTPNTYRQEQQNYQQQPYNPQLNHQQVHQQRPQQINRVQHLQYQPSVRQQKNNPKTNRYAPSEQEHNQQQARNRHGFDRGQHQQFNGYQAPQQQRYNPARHQTHQRPHYQNIDTHFRRPVNHGRRQNFGRRPSSSSNKYQEKPQKGCKLVEKEVKDLPEGEKRGQFSSKRYMMVKECFFGDSKPYNGDDGRGSESKPEVQTQPFDYKFDEDSFFKNFFGDDSQQDNQFGFSEDHFLIRPFKHF